MNGIVPIDSGGIMLSYKCNCRCRHCLYAAGPSWNGFMEVQDVGHVFQGLLQTSRYLRGFHLGGGEPFLDFDRLLRVQRLATEFGIPIEYVETNASWCVEEAAARDKLEQLRDAGLLRLLVSCSPFHAERIPLNRVTTAVRVGSDVFGPDGVIIWVPEFYRQLSQIRTDGLIRLSEYAASVGQRSAEFMVRSGYSLISGGRAGYELAGFYDCQPPEACEGDHCRMELLESGHAHFDPYGNLIPAFCSGISLGDARDLPALFGGFDLSTLPLIDMLVERGPYALYEFAVSEFAYSPLDGGYIGKCHLCVDVRRCIRGHTDQFAELAPAQFYEQLAA
ncbi:MAG TPA: radical SAM protein [Armatimonadota bacterium]|nr:radical SAM protein [Armatimonadota bacterium]